MFLLPENQRAAIYGAVLLVVMKSLQIRKIHVSACRGFSCILQITCIGNILHVWHQCTYTCIGFNWNFEDILLHFRFLTKDLADVRNWNFHCAIEKEGCS